MNQHSPISRRQMLQTTACGFGSIALAGISASAKEKPSQSTKQPMHVPTAKRVIFIFLQGAPSHVDIFDYKPSLEKYDGQKLDFKDSRKMANTGMTGQETVMKPFWKFRQYGESGHWVSDLFPNVAQRVDDICFIHSMHTNGVAHGPGTLFLHTGSTNFIMPSIGSWITYGLGSENENLPSFITISPTSGNGGPRNYSNAFLPARYQGTSLGRVGLPAKDAKFRFVSNPKWSNKFQRQQFELLQSLNRHQSANGQHEDKMSAEISSYELAFRMQQHAPQLTNLEGETKATLQLYGINEKVTEDFGRQCLLARRMAEAGVRYIQITHGDNTINPAWDHHSKMQRHEPLARHTDKPIAALLSDLKARGLLEDTLVWWGAEFGRNPFTQGNDGRDHNPKGFTHFLAGGGVKSGFSYGSTDEFGHEAVENKVHMHDMHATILHLLGLDHEKLTYRHAGRDYRLTDVEGNVVHDIIG